MQIRITNGISNYRRSIDEIKSMVRQFYSLDRSSIQYGEIKKTVGEIISDYSKPDAGWILNGIFRARKNRDGKSFSKFKEVFAPENRDVTKWGRLNQPGEAIFYGSEKRDVCLYELRPAPGDVVTIAQYEPIRQFEADLLDLAIYETDCA